MEYIKTPVTALSIENDVIFAGFGSFLKIYKFNQRSRTFDISCCEKVLKRHVVHGMKSRFDAEKGRLLIYGGKEWCLYEVKQENDTCLSLHSITSSLLHDWIWDLCELYPTEEAENLCYFPPQIAFALGHNSVVLYDWMKKKVLLESQCEEKCILYSAHFIRQAGLTLEELILCSGTVFNQVVIWAPGRKKNAQGAVPILERIQAHDGVIFHIYFDFYSMLLVTASDDRSIRIWSCETLSNLNTSSRNANPQQKQTTTCLCKLYGHESRVWRAQLCHHDKELYLASVGEDGFCLLWHLNHRTAANSEDLGMLEGNVVKKMKCHRGRNIWSLFLDNRTLATGGGDGGIRIWKMSQLADTSIKTTKHPCDQELLNNGQSIGVPKSLHLCSDSVLVHTDLGSLLRYNITTSEWAILNQDPNFKSYAIMRVHDDENMVAIGNTNGEVCVLFLNKSNSVVIDKKTFSAAEKQGKIHNLSWVFGKSTLLLFVSGPSGELVSHVVETSQEPDKTSHLRIKKVFSWELPMAKHRWHMGVTAVPHGDHEYIVCGDRRGSIHLYKYGEMNPLYTLQGVHNKTGVTSVTSLGESIITTGKDGIWRRIAVDFELGHLKVAIEKRASQGMDWLESIIVHPSEDLIVLGFHGRNFTAWSSRTGDILLSIECGGGHRDWSFKTNKGESVLAFIKAGDLHLGKVFSNILEEDTVVEPSFHGRQITCVKYIETYVDPGSNQTMSVLATGSEDTKLIFSLYFHERKEDKLAGNLQTLLVLDDHISSIRTICTVPVRESDNTSEYFLFSGGGRATIHCYRVTINWKKSWQKCCTVEHICAHVLNNDTRNKRISTCVNTDTRYMAMTAWRSDKDYFLAVACSDAVLRLFSLDIESNCLLMQAKSCNHSHCFLTITNISVFGKTFLLSGATDGNLVLWNVNEVTHPKSVHQLPEENERVLKKSLIFLCHQSGINSLDIIELPPFSHPTEENTDAVQFLTATGSDDNTITLLLLKLSNQDDFQEISRTVVTKAHSAQITGLKFNLEPDFDQLQLLSASIDQRLTTWSIKLHQTGVKCEFRSSKLCDVADVSSVDIWHSKHRESFLTFVAICGQGIEICRT